MDVRARLSMAFAFTEDLIHMSHNLVSGLSIPDAKKEEILQDLVDTRNIMQRRNFADMGAIEEAITALTEVNDYVKNLPGDTHLKECLEHILQWLHHIKRIMTWGTIEVPQTPSYVYYVDDAGNMVYLGLDENDIHLANDD